MNAFWVLEIGHIDSRPDRTLRYWDGLDRDVTPEVQWAIRFADKQSAERMGVLYLEPETWKAVEHGWMVKP